MGDPYKAVKQLHRQAQELAVSKPGLVERFKIMVDAEEERVNDLDKRAAPFLEMAQDIGEKVVIASRTIREVRLVLQGVK